ncbi:DNA cytosine methyltransferase [uncultured Kiloniella sp.]|uniref:DNA cytosine methyltransferase n=1 Tax=uncultured Kiloniella sp. TaxID=1133091 RepID=UPI002611EC23|nr:DNA cytosine methyltransferase [uncultured Kiloniella sp.]
MHDYQSVNSPIISNNGNFYFQPSLEWINFIDLFCGGGGVSEAFKIATGQEVKVAVNHNTPSIKMHEVNHPNTRHYLEDLRESDPVTITEGKKVHGLWLSPDCTHFSLARGGVPIRKKERGLAWMGIKWVGKIYKHNPDNIPDVLYLENVSEFADWSRLIAKRDKTQPGKRVLRVDGSVPLNGERTPVDQQIMVPDRSKKYKGRGFKNWCKALKKYGYIIEFRRKVEASRYGDGTSRTRLLVIARSDGKPIVWPEASHGEPDSEEVKSGTWKAWPIAADIIDWNNLGYSVFLSSEEAKSIRKNGGPNIKRPLADNTLRRCIVGLHKFVAKNPKPFIKEIEGPIIAPVVGTIDQQSNKSGVAPLTKPLSTITRKSRHMLVSPVLAKHYGGVIGCDVKQPVPTLTKRSTQIQPVCAVLARDFGKSNGADIKSPVPTLTSGGSGKTRVVSATLAKLYGTSTAAPIEKPVPTITATGKNLMPVAAVMTKYYGNSTAQPVDKPIDTLTTKDRFNLTVAQFQRGTQAEGAEKVRALIDKHIGLDIWDGTVVVDGERWVIVDILTRMLTPREQFTAQGFPADYIIDRDIDGNPITATEQTARCGNSVPPNMAAAHIRANQTQAFSPMGVAAE